MGIQKYRADVADAPDANGAVAWRTEWMGGKTLAKVVNCPIQGTTRRQVAYAMGEADTFFSVPAAIMVRGKKVSGFLTGYDAKWEFVPSKALFCMTDIQEYIRSADVNCFADSSEERTAFEKALGYGTPSIFNRDKKFPTKYANMEVQYAWLGWNYKLTDMKKRFVNKN